MGSSISRPSGECIPTPNDDLKLIFEDNGFEIGEKIDEKGLMTKVKFPENYGIIITSDRGDLCHGKICDTSGNCLASFTWCDKGYENYTYISKNNDNLDISNYNLIKGVFKPKRNDRHDYIDLLNDYYESQYRGFKQVQLDKKYNIIKDFEESKPNLEKENYIKLDEQDPYKKEINVAKACLINFEKPFQY